MPPEQLIKPTVPIKPVPPQENKQTTTPQKPLPFVATALTPQTTSQSAAPQAPVITPAGVPAAPIVPQPMVDISDPAKTLGTVGLVLAIFIPPAGAAVSGFAFAKSNKLGYSNYRALAGIVVGVFMSIVALMFFSIV